jgi:nitrogen permease regulator 3-like protein
LSTISTSAAKKSDNHFFASVVRFKDLIPLYHDVVIWMLKRDMLITLHLRIRIVATQELKMRVRLARVQAKARKAAEGRRGRKRREHSGLRQEIGPDDSPEIPPPRTSWISFSPKSARKHSQRFPSRDGQLSDLALDDDVTSEDEDEEYDHDDDDDDDEKDDGTKEDTEYINYDDHKVYLWPTMISDPGRANPLQRRWLSAMSEGKDPEIAKRFEQ